MNFERFLDINIKDNNHFIVFNNNKILYESESKSFLLDGKFLDIDIENSVLVGIAKNNGINIYGLDITKSMTNINIGYKNLNELDTRHLLSILKPDEIVLMGRANQLLHWIKSNKYSGYSGELNKFDSNEQSLFCPTSSSMIYPSISPCVLAMVTKDDEILLARNNLFPKGLYSVLAGFVEVSESAEETVHREVLEEVNIKVKNIKYFGSQPWPFPSQLMLGFTCEYDSGIIKVDEKIPSGRKPLDSVRNEIEKIITANIEKDSQQRWLAKLKKDAYVEINLPN